MNLKAVSQGTKNYNFKKPEIEKRAKIRTSKMQSCENFKKEPNRFLRVSDKSIPELDGMMCEDCGCEMPIKARQNIVECKCWNE